MIYQITNALLIPKIMELARSVPDAEGLEKLEDVLINSLRDAHSKIYVYEKDGELKAFMFGSITEFDGAPSVFIEFCVCQPGDNQRNIVNELLARAQRWGQELGLKHIYFMTTRNTKAFARKYKFRFYATVLRREIKQDEQAISKQEVVHA